MTLPDARCTSGSTVVIIAGHSLTEREREVLFELESFARSASAHPDWHPQWAKPMDVGGRNGSHHSYSLAKFARKGLAERRQRGMFALSDTRGFLRGSWEYRISDFGREVVEYLQSGLSGIEWLRSKGRIGAPA